MELETNFYFDPFPSSVEPSSRHFEYTATCTLRDFELSASLGQDIPWESTTEIEPWSFTWPSLCPVTRLIEEEPISLPDHRDVLRDHSIFPNHNDRPSVEAEVRVAVNEQVATENGERNEERAGTITTTPQVPRRMWGKRQKMDVTDEIKLKKAVLKVLIRKKADKYKARAEKLMTTSDRSRERVKRHTNKMEFD